MQFQEKTNGQTFQKKKQQHAVFRSLASKNESANFSKKKADAVRRKTNGQTLQPATSTQSLKEKQTDKHFEKQTNVVLGKNKRTNISKKKQMQF